MVEADGVGGGGGGGGGGDVCSVLCSSCFLSFQVCVCSSHETVVSAHQHDNRAMNGKFLR